MFAPEKHTVHSPEEIQGFRCTNRKTCYAQNKQMRTCGALQLFFSALVDAVKRVFVSEFQINFCINLKIRQETAFT